MSSQQYHPVYVRGDTRIPMAAAPASGYDESDEDRADDVSSDTPCSAKGSSLCTCLYGLHWLVLAYLAYVIFSESNTLGSFADDQTPWIRVPPPPTALHCPLRDPIDQTYPLTVVLMMDGVGWTHHANWTERLGAWTSQRRYDPDTQEKPVVFMAQSESILPSFTAPNWIAFLTSAAFENTLQYANDGFEDNVHWQKLGNIMDQMCISASTTSIRSHRQMDGTETVDLPETDIGTGTGTNKDGLIPPCAFFNDEPMMDRLWRLATHPIAYQRLRDQTHAWADALDVSACPMAETVLAALRDMWKQSRFQTQPDQPSTPVEYDTVALERLIRWLLFTECAGVDAVDVLAVRSLWLYLSNADYQAHEHGRESDEYRDAVYLQGESIERVLTLLDTGRAWRERPVHVLLVSDHGHIAPGGHGGIHRSVRYTPFYHIYLPPERNVDSSISSLSPLPQTPLEQKGCMSALQSRHSIEGKDRDAAIDEHRVHITDLGSVVSLIHCMPLSSMSIGRVPSGEKNWIQEEPFRKGIRSDVEMFHEHQTHQLRHYHAHLKTDYTDRTVSEALHPDPHSPRPEDDIRDLQWEQLSHTVTNRYLGGVILLIVLLLLWFASLHSMRAELDKRVFAFFPILFVLLLFSVFVFYGAAYHSLSEFEWDASDTTGGNHLRVYTAMVLTLTCFETAVALHVYARYFQTTTRNEFYIQLWLANAVYWTLYLYSISGLYVLLPAWRGSVEWMAPWIYHAKFISNSIFAWYAAYQGTILVYFTTIGVKTCIQCK